MICSIQSQSFISATLPTLKFEFDFSSRKHVMVQRTLTLLNNRAVVVAQLVEQLLSTPEVCASNPVIGKLLPIWNISLLSRRK